MTEDVWVIATGAWVPFGNKPKRVKVTKELKGYECLIDVGNPKLEGWCHHHLSMRLPSTNFFSSKDSFDEEQCYWNAAP